MEDKIGDKEEYATKKDYTVLKGYILLVAIFMVFASLGAISGALERGYKVTYKT